MQESESRYSKRGVSSSKKEVHDVVDKMDKGLFKGTFVRSPKTCSQKIPKGVMLFILTGQEPSLL